MKNIRIMLPVIIIALTGLAVNCSCSGDKRPGDMPEMKMPYLALNIALQTQVVVNDREYLRELEKKSGMSRKQVRRLINYLLKNQTIDEIKKNAGDELSRSLEELRGLSGNEKLNFYVINVLAPYLTMTVNGFDVNNTAESEIQSQFAEIFNVPQDKVNPLLELVEGSASYHSGGIFRSSSLYKLNEYLKKSGFGLDYQLIGSYANIFKIEHVICGDKEWKPGEKISILLLRRIYPNFLGSKLGYAPAEHSDVFILRDLHHNLAKEYKNELRTKLPRTLFADQSHLNLWRSLGLKIDLESANWIRYELMHKDLSGSSLSQIEKNLITQTAIHEAKHRIDAIEMPDMRLNLDLEISAYLATAILGGYPFLELRSMIEWTEAYFRGTRHIRLRELLAELWTLADSTLKRDDAEEFLRAELRKIYENYRTIQGRAQLINLDEFEQRMLPVITSNAILLTNLAHPVRKNAAADKRCQTGERTNLHIVVASGSNRNDQNGGGQNEPYNNVEKTGEHPLEQKFYAL
jgi:hypothetical protein